MYHTGFLYQYTGCGDTGMQNGNGYGTRLPKKNPDLIESPLILKETYYCTRLWIYGDPLEVVCQRLLFKENQP